MAKGLNTFKKFSEISNSKININDEEIEIDDLEEYIPGNPNLPKDSTKKQVPISSSKEVKPKIEDDNEDSNDEDDSVLEKNVKFFGKVAKLPKNTLASKGYSFLESVKISKNSIWYIMIEKQDNELQMLKYNYKKGVDLNSFVNDLKSYYTTRFSKNQKIVEKISNIKIDGNDKFSVIRNIPQIEVDGRKMISIITNDLISLLSK